MVDVKVVESVGDRSTLDGCPMKDKEVTISTTSSGRRRCHYRQPPRGLGLDDNSSVASFTTTKSSSASTKNSVPSSSLLRIGHKQPAVVAATSFAAAISPTTSSASSMVSVGRRTKKSGLFNSATNHLIMSSSPPTTMPLLGANPSPPKTKNKVKVGEKKRGGLMGAIRAPLKHVSKKVSALKRGKKSLPQPNHRGLDRVGSSSSSTAYSKYDSPVGSDASVKEGQERPLEAVPEASSFDDSQSYLELEGFMRSPSGNDLAQLAASESTVKEMMEQKGDPSLEDVPFSQGGIGAALVTCDPMPVSPKTDQAAEAIEAAHGDDDGFDDIVLMPRLQDIDEGGSSSSARLPRVTSQGSLSVLSQEDENRVRFDEALALAMSRRSKGEAETPKAFYGSYFHFENKGASKKKRKDTKKEKPRKVDEEPDDFRASAHSIPSICDDGCCFEEVNASRVIIQEYSEETADSTVAWGVMGMILGSPAPTAVLAKKKGSAADVWKGKEDIDTLPEDLADIVLATSYEHTLDSDCSVSSMSPEGEDMASNAEDSVPDILDDYDEDVTAQTAPAVTHDSIAENADSTLAWTALAAILASPAPKTVVKRSRSRLGLDLWGSAEESDALPEVNQVEDATCEEQEINFDELLGAEGVSHAKEQLKQHEADSKKGADSVLAWGALGMFLGSPAPSNAVKRSSSRLGLDLWAGEEESDALPDIEAEDVACEDQEINLDDLLDAEGASHAEERMTEPVVDSKEGADSVLAWGALGMFLGSPAPTLAIKRSASRQSLDLWGSEEESDQLPDIIEEEKQAVDNEDRLNCQEKNNNPLPSLSETFDDDSDGNSMPSLAGTSNNSDRTLEDCPLTLAGSYATSIST